MDFTLLIAISIVIGLAIGILSGMLGVGGGMMMVPVLRLGYGLAGIAATATSLFAIIPTSLTGAIKHIRNKTCVPQFGLAAGIGGGATSTLGVWLASLSPDWLILLAASLVIAYTSITMLVKARKAWVTERAAKSCADSQQQPRDGQFVTGDFDRQGLVTKKNLAKCVGIGLCAGVVSGYVGVGGAFLMTPLMMQLFKMPMKLTAGTSLIGVIILAIPGTIMQAALGNIDWVAGIALSCGAIPGALIGASLTTRVPESALRFIFGLVLLAAAILMVLF